MIDALKAQLRAHEGQRLKPYTDPRGYLTIGVGRNLDTRGITAAEADYLLDNDIRSTMAEVTRRVPWFPELDPGRQMAVLDLAFTVGPDGLMGFSRLLDALKHRDFARAAAELRDSRWARQVQPARLARLCSLLDTGA